MQDFSIQFYGEGEGIFSPPVMAGHGNDDITASFLRVKSAWYLRSVDTEKAIKLLDERSDFFDRSSAFSLSVLGRDLACRAECLRLQSLFSDAQSLIDKAREVLSNSADFILLGDVEFIQAEIKLSMGHRDDAMRHMADAVSHYISAGDDARRIMASCWIGYQESYNDAERAERNWHAILSLPVPENYSFEWAYICLLHGGISFQRGDFPEAIRQWQRGFDIAFAFHVKPMASFLATITGAAYANLYDIPTALEWKERAYTLVKDTGWHEMIGAALASMAETMTSTGDWPRAQNLFHAALPHLAYGGDTRKNFIAYNAYGNLCLLQAQFDMALHWFEKAKVISDKLGHPDLSKSIYSNLATTLLKLGALERAEDFARKIWDGAGFGGNPYYEIEALKCFAAIQREKGPGRTREAIKLLEEAVALAERLDGLVLRADILTELARDYEATGDYQKALHYERRARDSWQRNFDRQNGARILAMQVRFDTARAKADAEHHRELARSEAARAATLDEANQILERLGQVGQEITAKLDYEGVFQTIYGHIKELMPADFLSIGLVDEDRQIVDVRYRVEDGQRLGPRQVALSADSLVALCARENREVLARSQDGRPPTQVPGTRAMHTVLVRPLTIGDRVLGVISVQSGQTDAYGQRERRIFSTLCAYSAIALSNAETYDQLERAVGDLREALHRLVQQEKMAALGQLVAGVAHEVNTPLGVTLSAISLLHDNIQNLQESLSNGGLTRSNLTEHLQTGLELSSLAQRNVVRASDMIRSFKEVAVDRGSDDRRVFDLGDYLREIANLMKAKLTGSGSQISLDIDLIQMDTYPGALAQTITNLLANVADHAYGPDRAGPIRVQARQTGNDKVEITVADEGEGMAAEVLAHVFDPFFTTNRAAGHMGLGLHVAYNQVTQRLGGSIHLHSEPGCGTVATIRIPRELPIFGRSRAIHIAEASVVF